MQQTSGLARLVGSLKDLDGAAGALADRLTSSKQSLAQEMATTTTIIETVEKTRDALRHVNQQMMTGDNGGPAGPLPDSLPPPAPSSAPQSPQAKVLSPPFVDPPPAPPPANTSFTVRGSLPLSDPPGGQRMPQERPTIHAPPSHPPQPHLAAGGFETTNTIRNRQ